MHLLNLHTQLVHELASLHSFSQKHLVTHYNTLTEMNAGANV